MTLFYVSHGTSHCTYFCYQVVKVKEQPNGKNVAMVVIVQNLMTHVIRQEKHKSQTGSKNPSDN